MRSMSCFFVCCLPRSEGRPTLPGGHVITPLLNILAAPLLQVCSLLCQLLKALMGRHALWLCNDGAACFCLEA